MRASHSQGAVSDGPAAAAAAAVPGLAVVSCTIINSCAFAGRWSTAQLSGSSQGVTASTNVGPAPELYSYLSLALAFAARVSCSLLVTYLVQSITLDGNLQLGST